MATLVYNGVQLPFQKNTGGETLIKSDDGADLLHIEKKYVVTSILTPELKPAGLTFRQWIALIQAALEEPRRPLRVDFGGGQIVASDATTDCKNGPWPEVLEWTEFAGKDAVAITFRVTACTRNCGTGQIISNRWEESVGIDGKDFLTTLTRTGKLVIAPGPLVPDDFRALVTPPIPAGFKAVRSDYKVQSDGLALSYTLIRKEVAVGIPPGCTHAEGTSRVTADKGIWKFAEVSLTLQADKEQSKQALLELAIVVAMERLFRFGIQKGTKKPTWQVLSGSIGEKLFENEVTIHLRTLLSQPKKPNSAILNALFPGIANKLTGPGVDPGNPAAGGGLPGRLARFLNPGLVGKLAPLQPGDDPRQQGNPPVPKSFQPTAYASPPLGSEPKQSPDPGLRSTAGLKLVAAALNDPCLTALVAAQERALIGTNAALAPAGDVQRLAAGATARDNALVGAANAAANKGGNAPPANVVVVQSIEQDVSEDYPDSLYTDYRIWRNVVRKSGLMPMSEQRVNGKTHMVRLEGASATMEIRWTAERVGEPPEPLPQDLRDPAVVLIDTEDSDGSIEDTTSDGVTMIFRRSGIYRYAFTDASAADRVGLSLPPWVAELIGLPPLPVVFGGPPNNPTTNELRGRG